MVEETERKRIINKVKEENELGGRRRSLNYYKKTNRGELGKKVKEEQSCEM